MLLINMTSRRLYNYVKNHPLPPVLCPRTPNRQGHTLS
jgi:hypothetical protein